MALDFLYRVERSTQRRTMAIHISELGEVIIKAPSTKSQKDIEY